MGTDTLERMLGFRVLEDQVEYLSWDEDGKEHVRAVQPILHERDREMWKLLVSQYSKIENLKNQVLVKNESEQAALADRKRLKDEVLSLRNGATVRT